MALLPLLPLYTTYLDFDIRYQRQQRASHKTYEQAEDHIPQRAFHFKYVSSRRFAWAIPTSA
jgi:hypothetical protein